MHWEQTRIELNVCKINSLNLSPHVRLGMQIPEFGKYFSRNPVSWALESGIQHKESGISLAIVIRNPRSTARESEIQELESEIHDVDSRNPDCTGFPVAWGDTFRSS